MSNEVGLNALATLASASNSTAGEGSTQRETEGTSSSAAAVSSNAAAAATSTYANNSNAETSALPPSSSSSVSAPNAPHITPAQLQQLVNLAAASGGNPNALAGAPGLSLLSGMQQHPPNESASIMMAMQNAANYNNLLAASHQQNQLSALTNLAMQLSRSQQQPSHGIGLSLQNPLASLLADTAQRQGLGGAAGFAHHSQGGDAAGNSANITTTSKGTTATAPIAPQPRGNVGSGTTAATSFEAYHHRGGDSDGGMSDGPSGDKREQKRAANRRSAQLSRKRKKQFIEELKEENDDLRRKEQILKSLPDLVVVFDSSGKLGFVSHSVDRLLRFSATELEGTSFWDRLCEESVRLLKAAFMDSLATREDGSDTAPLGAGVWELRLVDKDNSQKLVVLNGVVHFAGERPECVCTIRPREGPSSKDKISKKSGLPTVSIDTRQSAVGAMDRPSAAKKVKACKTRDLVRISDSGNSTPESAESESGSSDE